MAAKTGGSNKALIPIIGVVAAVGIAAVAWALLGGGESDEPVINPAPAGRAASQRQVEEKAEPTKPRQERAGRRTVEAPEERRGRATSRMERSSSKDKGKDKKRGRSKKNKKKPEKKVAPPSAVP